MWECLVFRYAISFSNGSATSLDSFASIKLKEDPHCQSWRPQSDKRENRNEISGLSTLGNN